MARVKATIRSTTTVSGRKTGGRARGTAVAAGNTGKNARQEGAAAEWDDVADELDVIPDIDGLLDRPAANRGGDTEARRRIEMLREERMLQQALSDVFDF